MRLGASQSFGTIFDRQPTAIQLFYQADAIGPHALTVRATTSIPANTFALICGWNLSIRRRVIAAPVGRVFARNQVFVFAVTRFIGHIFFEANTVGSIAQETGYLGVAFANSPTVEIVTEDLGTGGSNDYLLTIGIQRFNEQV